MNRSTPITSVKTPGCVALSCAVACMLLGASGAHASDAAPLQEARRSLARYEIGSGDTSTLATLVQLSMAAQAAQSGSAAHAEMRFLRAAAATDLLVLAHVRGDASFEALLAATLGVAAGVAITHLDSELLAFTQPGYREQATEMRAALASIARREAWPLGELDRSSGSQRDLLFVHAFVQACGSDGDVIANLARRALDPCGGAAPCVEPYAGLDTRGRIAAHALAEAGKALGRLQEAAEAGDPLPAAATSELAVFQILLAAVELSPGMRPAHTESWVDANGASAGAAPGLKLWVSEQGVRYAFAPHLKLGAGGVLELVAAAKSGTPASGELKIASSLRPFVHPLPELIDWLRVQLAADPVLTLAVEATAGTSVLMLGRVLVSVERAGQKVVIVMGRSASGQYVAQRVALADSSTADTRPEATLALRVRAGGFSLRHGAAPSLDLPRVRDQAGVLQFDLDALSAQLEGKRVDSAQLSFMSELTAEPMTIALFEVAKRSRSLELLLPY